MSGVDPNSRLNAGLVSEVGKKEDPVHAALDAINFSGKLTEANTSDIPENIARLENSSPEVQKTAATVAGAIEKGPDAVQEFIAKGLEQD